MDSSNESESESESVAMETFKAKMMLSLVCEDEICWIILFGTDDTNDIANYIRDNIDKLYEQVFSSFVQDICRNAIEKCDLVGDVKTLLKFYNTNLEKTIAKAIFKMIEHNTLDEDIGNKLNAGKRLFKKIIKKLTNDELIALLDYDTCHEHMRLEPVSKGCITSYVC